MPLQIITTPPPSLISRMKRKAGQIRFKWKNIIESKFMSNEEYLWESICNEDLVPLPKLEKFILKHEKKLKKNGDDILIKIKPTYHGYHGNKDRTAMHMAFGGRATVKTVKLVMFLLDLMEDRMKEIGAKNDNCPIEALTIGTRNNGETPLHLACGINYTRRVMIQEEMIIQLMLDTIAKHEPTGKKVMTIKNDDHGETAFHIMCRRRGFHLPLYERAVRIHPQVLSMLDSRNHTPLHMGFKYNTSFEINEYLIKVTPYEALHIVENEEGKTPLHTLCETMDQRAADLISILIKRAPMLCFAVDKKGKIPFELCLQAAERRLLRGQLNDMMRFKTTLECLYKSMLTKTKSLLESFDNTILQLNFDLIELLYMKNDDDDDQHNSGLSGFGVSKQTMFCQYVTENANFRNFLLGVERMNTVGKRLEGLQEEGYHKERGIQVIDSVINNLDCIYLHLRENPSLCK